MKYLLLMILLSCGKIVVETDVPDNVNLGPDFEAAAAFCDERYGKKSLEAEMCFQDYRDYFQIQLSVDESFLVSFCYTKYESEIEVDSCVDDLLKINETVNYNL